MRTRDRAVPAAEGGAGLAAAAERLEREPGPTRGVAGGRGMRVAVRPLLQLVGIRSRQEDSPGALPVKADNEGHRRKTGKISTQDSPQEPGTRIWYCESGKRSD